MALPFQGERVLYISMGLRCRTESYKLRSLTLEA
jgi:hypothetical protein